MEDTIYLIYAIFSFTVGTLFGSFFTLAIYRLPRKQDITHTRSYCPNCKHRLGFFDCFPILSYVSTVGRCKYCNKKISIRYPLIELASGFVFLFIFMFFGLSWKSLILVACYVYLFLVIGSDVMEKKMTDEEKKQVEEIVNAKKKQKENKKAGGLNIDIAVAVVIFVFFFLVAIYTIANYSNKLSMYRRQIDATGVCLNIMNTEKSKDYDDLTDRVGEEKVEKITYNYTVTITNKLKDTGETLSNAKNINVTVSYLLKGETYTVSLDSLKVGDTI